jgi:hypothetical protein
VVISWPLAAPTAQVIQATVPDIQPKPCTLHGTGWASEIPIQLSPREVPRLKLRGTFAQGVEWNDISPSGSARAATIDITRGGIRVHAFAHLGDRTFWLSKKSGSLDGITFLRPGRRVKALGVEDGEAIVELEDHHLHPSNVVARAGCDELGTDASIAPVEAPLPGNIVRPVHSRGWVRFLAQPNGPVERTADLSSSEVRVSHQQGTFVYAHARLDNADVEGWVAQSELHNPRGGYGLAGHTIGIGLATANCGGAPMRKLKTNADLRIGPNGSGSVTLGEISQGTAVVIRATEGDLVNVIIPPCELVPANEGEAFWVESSALD